MIFRRKGKKSPEQVWSDLRSLVRELGDGAVGKFDPVAGPSRLTQRFELLISGGLHQSKDLRDTSVEALRSRIREHTASIVVLRMFLEGNPEIEDDTGGYLDLMSRWLRGRTAVLSSLYRQAGGAGELDRPEIGEAGDLEAESMLLAGLVIGLDNELPQDAGFPGIFVWLTESYGSASVLYRGWH